MQHMLRPAETLRNYTLYNNVILSGKAWIFVQGLVLVKALGVAHMPDGLQGLHTNMLGPNWLFLSLPHV